MFNAKEQRKRQIDTLKVFNDNVSEIKESEKYAIKFMSGKNEISLVIELDHDFPYNIPKLSVEPKFQHKWIENDQITKAPGILNFTINSDLGRVCQVIIREFEKNPVQFQSQQIVEPVKIQSSIKEIEGLEIDQLYALLNDDQCLDDFIEELQTVRTLNIELDSLIESNEKQAVTNLQKEGELNKLKESIESLSIDFLNLGSKYEATSKKYQDKSQEYLPENIRQLLEIAVSNAEYQCEESVDAFLNGKQSSSQFLENFMEIKKLIAIRKFKEERLNFQLNQLKL
ncbi:hypothetical protein ACKWTF_012538 [Chironomus riparius]